MTTEYNLKITKATNGWIVQTFDPYKNGSPAMCSYVVTEDQVLSDMIAAALVTGRLEGNQSISKQVAEQQWANSLGQRLDASLLATNAAAKQMAMNNVGIIGSSNTTYGGSYANSNP